MNDDKNITEGSRHSFSSLQYVWWDISTQCNRLWFYRVTRFLICEHWGQRPDRQQRFIISQT